MEKEHDYELTPGGDSGVLCERAEMTSNVARRRSNIKLFEWLSAWLFRVVSLCFSGTMKVEKLRFILRGRT